ncbi:hypothetical protein DXG01_016473 [Tephrocybe rancida]|nr:hypothetical protein DXG01_016473 [Tephrocybe rancida]
MGCIISYICPVPVLFLPSLFASQARPFLLDAAVIRDASDDERTVRRNSTSGITTPVEQIDHMDVEMITLPNITHIARPDIAHIPETSPLPRGWNSLPTIPPPISSTCPTERLDDASLKQVESSWAAYIKRCRKIWVAVASSSGTALAASAPLLQMPGTNGDPLVRALVYLSILRFFAAIPSALVLLYYFNKPSFKSPNFALVWYQSVKKYHQSDVYTLWSILALPAVIFCW